MTLLNVVLERKMNNKLSLSKSELVVLLGSIQDQILELNLSISDPKNKSVKKDIEKHKSILINVFYKIRDHQQNGIRRK